MQTHNIMNRLVEADILTEYEENDKEHIDVMRSVLTTVIQLLQQR